MPIELFIETITVTFDPVKPLVPVSQTCGWNCTYTASVGRDSLVVGVELPLV